MILSYKNLIEIQISNYRAKPWYCFLSKLFLWLLKRDLKRIKREERIKANKKQKSAVLDKRKLPKCRCSDVNECDTWCVGKENYTRAQKYDYE